MAAPDTSKSIHNFHCRDALWELYERMSRELDCSIDYLINEALRNYAQASGYIEGEAPEPVTGTADLSRGSRPPPLPAASAPNRGSLTRPVVPKPGTGEIRPARPSSDMLPRPSAAAQTAGTTGSRRVSGSSSASGSRLPMLTCIFQGRKVPINREQFIIGRGTKTSDLTIRDTNISRKHAGVIFHNGSFYIKDLGSTNGIEFEGRRIDSKRINEGDVFYLCDYELHFTYEN